MGFPSAENQNSTVGSLTLLIYTALSLCTGIILPYLSSIHKPLTMRRLWVASLGLFGLAMMGTFVVFSTTGTIVLFACVGFSWAVSAWIPYALLGAEACRIAEQRDICRSLCCDDSNTGEGNGSRDEDEILDQLGLIYGLHNLSICLPQILMCVGISLALVISGAKNSRIDGQTLDPVWILRLGGVLALIAMYVATGIREPFEESFSAEHSHCDGDGKIE
jgi:solute carrier family 45 protein 1/2/4